MFAKDDKSEKRNKKRIINEVHNGGISNREHWIT
jgi:hypothetical protein